MNPSNAGNFEAKSDGIEVESEERSGEIAIAKVVLEPGGSSGWHHHSLVSLWFRSHLALGLEYDNKCERRVSTRRARGS